MALAGTAPAKYQRTSSVRLDRVCGGFPLNGNLFLYDVIRRATRFSFPQKAFGAAMTLAASWELQSRKRGLLHFIGLHPFPIPRIISNKNLNSSTDSLS
jgi:hypothetical protein